MTLLHFALFKLFVNSNHWLIFMYVHRCKIIKHKYTDILHFSLNCKQSACLHNRHYQLSLVLTELTSSLLQLDIKNRMGGLPSHAIVQIIVQIIVRNLNYKQIFLLGSLSLFASLEKFRVMEISSKKR